MKLVKKFFLSSLLIIPFMSIYAQADYLAPNDDSVNSDLVLWLRDPVNNYDSLLGQWNDLSDNDFDANSVGVSPTNEINYVSPTISAESANGGIAHNASVAYFAPEVDDLLKTPGLNNDTGLSDLTIFTVYQVDSATVTGSAGASNIRPAGFGSAAAEGSTTSFLSGDKFNLALDPSIRKDNGNVGSGAYSQAHPENGTMIIRVSRMDSSTGVVTEWFNSTGTLARVMDSASTAAFTTGTDVFYLGDVRAGVSIVRNTAVEADMAIAEVAVYKSALSDAQVEEIAGWLNENVGLPLKPVVDVQEINGSIIVSERTPDVAGNFTVALVSEPAAPVTVTVTAGNIDPNMADYRPFSDDVKLNGNSIGTDLNLVFDSSNWNIPQTINVTAVDDENEERVHMAVLSIVTTSNDTAFNGGGGMVVPVTIIDNDAAGFLIGHSDNKTIVAEGGVADIQSSDTFSLYLSYEPTSDVQVAFTETDGDSTADLIFSPETLTFTSANYSTAQTITVTAVDDDSIEAESEILTVTLTITSEDEEYQALAAELNITIYDNDCGAAGYSSMDSNQDCIVDVKDFAEFALQFLTCTYPNNPACE